MNPNLSSCPLTPLISAASADSSPLGRRALLLAAAMAPLVSACSAPARITKDQARHAISPAQRDAQAKWRELEASSGGRLGVSVYPSDGDGLHYRSEERFPVTSTFKALAAAGVLAQSTNDSALMQRRIAVKREELVTYSPITSKHADADMTLAELCDAAVRFSDNTAGNLLLRQLGGPPGLTRYVRSLGDEAFRLDRWETELNTCIPGDPRDTCTPADMARNAHRLLIGAALEPVQRAQLVQWMLTNTTGDARIRAGVPSGWRVADKTGGGDYGTTNDLAVLWPATATSGPLALGVYFTQPAKDAKARNDVIAEAARIAVSAIEARA